MGNIFSRQENETSSANDQPAPTPNLVQQPIAYMQAGQVTLHDNSVAQQNIFANASFAGPSTLHEPHIENFNVTGSSLNSLPQATQEKLLQDTIQKLKRKAEEEINNDGDLLQDLHLYIPLDGAKAAGDDSGKDLGKQVIEEFLDLQSKAKVMLLQGNSGSGKSTFGRYIEQRLWAEINDGKMNQSAFLPLFISLPRLADPTKNIVEQVLERKGVSDAIGMLKASRTPILLILDGYDEIKCKANLYRDSQLDQWNARVLISCRSQYLAGIDYREQFMLIGQNHQLQANSLRELHILPFNAERRLEYINKFAASSKSLSKWDGQDYQQALTKIQNVEQLTREPFMLRMVLDILPGLIERKQESMALQLTKASVYDKFTEKWFERERRRIGDIPQFKAIISSISPKVLLSRFDVFSQDLAYAMLQHNTQVASTPEEHINLRGTRTIEGEFKNFFNLDDEVYPSDSVTKKEQEERNKKKIGLEGSPLRKVGVNQFRFVHQSFQEYFVSKKLLAELCNGLDDSASNFTPNYALNQQPLNQELAIRAFMADRVLDKSEPYLNVEEKLWEMVQASSHDPNLQVAAANSVMVLNDAHIPLANRTLDGARLDGADLTAAIIDHSSLKGASLKNVILHQAWLRHVALEGTELSGDNFTNAIDIGVKVQKVVISGNGQILAVLLAELGDQESTIRLFNLMRQEWVGENIVLSDVVNKDDEKDDISSFMTQKNLAINYAGTLLATSRKNTITLWDIATQKNLGQQRVSFSHYSTHSVAHQLSRSLLFMEDQGHLIVAQNRAALIPITLAGKLGNPYFLPLTKELIQEHEGASAKERTKSTGPMYPGLEKVQSSNIEIATSTAVPWLAIAQGKDILIQNKASLLRTSGESNLGTNIPAIDDAHNVRLLKEKSTVSTMYFNEDGSRLYVGTSAGEVTVWNSDTWAQVTRFSAGEVKVDSLLVSQDQRWILASYANKELRVWDTINLRCVQIRRNILEALYWDQSTQLVRLRTAEGIITLHASKIIGSELSAHTKEIIQLEYNQDKVTSKSIEQQGQQYYLLTRITNVNNGQCSSANFTQITLEQAEVQQNPQQIQQDKIRASEIVYRATADSGTFHNLRSAVTFQYRGRTKIITGHMDNSVRYWDYIPAPSKSSSSSRLTLERGEPQHELWIESVAHKQLDAYKDTARRSLEKLSYLIHAGATAKVQKILFADPDLMGMHLAGYFPIHMAAMSGREEIMRHMFDVNPAERTRETQGEDKKGQHALVLAAAFGFLQTAQWLLANGCNINYQVSQGRSFINYFAAIGSLSCVKFSLENGAITDGNEPGEITPLYLAAQNGHSDIVSLLLDRGTTIDAPVEDRPAPMMIASNYGRYSFQDSIFRGIVFVDAHAPKGWTPLMIAAFSNHIEVVRLLIKRGANVNYCNSTGWTAVHAAAIAGEPESLSVLSENGADIAHIAQGGCTPFLAAVQADRVEAAEWFLAKGADINAALEDGTTPLMVAAENGFYEMAELLLARGAQANEVGVGGNTPLIIAAQKGHHHVVELLLKAGADISHTNNEGWAPLFEAIRAGHRAAVKKILECRPNVHGETCKNWTPLFTASVHGRLDIVELLLKAGGDVNQRSGEGFVPLHFAASKGYCELVIMLLNAGANVDLAANNGQTALQIAAEKNNLDITVVLLDRGADANYHTEAGLTPLITAALNGHLAMVELLLLRGAQVKLAATQGFTALFAATQNGHQEIAELLLVRGADANYHTEDGLTPLIIASLNGRQAMVELLLRRGAQVELSTTQGLTPLLAASQNGHREVAELLLVRGSDANQADHEGRTPLLFASYFGHLPIVELLITTGAKVNLAPSDDSTPLLVAFQNGHEETIELLLSAGANASHVSNIGLTMLHKAVAGEQNDIVRLFLRHNVVSNAPHLYGIESDLLLKRFQQASIFLTQGLKGLAAKQLYETLTRFLATHANMLELKTKIQLFPDNLIFANIHNLACHNFALAIEISGQEDPSCQLYMQEAERLFKQAIELGITKSISTIEYANFLYINGRFNEAIPLLTEPLNLDEYGLSFDHTVRDAVPKDLGLEIDFHGKIFMHPNILGYYLLVLCHKQLGDEAKAKQVLEEFQNVLQASSAEVTSLDYSLLGYAAMHVGNYDQAMYAFDWAFELYEPTEANPDYFLALKNKVVCQTYMAKPAQEMQELNIANHGSDSQWQQGVAGATKIQSCWRGFVCRKDSLQAMEVTR